jgi:hypothetical protein
MKVWNVGAVKHGRNSARRPASEHGARKIRRCLKRYIARQLYRTLATAMTPAAETS